MYYKSSVWNTTMYVSVSYNMLLFYLSAKKSTNKLYPELPNDYASVGEYWPYTCFMNAVWHLKSPKSSLEDI